LAGVLLFCLLTATLASRRVIVDAASADPIATPDQAPLFRVFLKDGSSLVSYGELARVADRVVFSMPTSASAENPELHLVDIAAERVDWSRTVNYAESARATRYLATRAEADYAALTAEVAQALNDVALADDPAKRLAIVEKARRTLADWPPRHYGYKQSDVRQMITMLDEAIAGLRAATGAQRFDLSLVAMVDAPRLTEALLPAPSTRETIEQTLKAASLTDSAALRTSLLAVAVSAIERNVAELPAAWATSTKATLTATLTREVETDRAYQALASSMSKLASERARAADVRGVQQLLAQLKARDSALGASRPDAVNSIVALVEEQLDAARRLQLARDRWALKAPELRAYRSAIGDALQRLLKLGPALEDIRTLAGSGPSALATILAGAAAVLRAAAAVRPPDELKEAHGLLVSAAQLAENAATIRRQAALTGDMARAWNASSAAAGALMLSARAQAEIAAGLRSPQLLR
jgi:hypothetical protein